MTRDERQAQMIKAWKEYGGKATCIGATGFGKTTVALKIIQEIYTKLPTFRVLIIVPTSNLKDQWIQSLMRLNISLQYVSVEVLNGASKREAVCDLLIIDEAHLSAAELLSNIFNVVKYKLILCLTATLERLDGRHEIITRVAPICDSVDMQECLQNGWVSPFKEYVVLLDVDDISKYKEMNKTFNENFAFFNYDFDLAMQCLQPKARIDYVKKLMVEYDPNTFKKLLSEATIKSAQVIRTIRKRKEFIANHPKKLEVARKIIKARPNSKIITFSSTVENAEAIGIGLVYAGKKGNKANKATLKAFKEAESGVLNTSKMADQGLDIPSIDVGINLAVDSSKIRAIQRLGRTVRLYKDKQAEYFTIVIRECVETKWFNNSRANRDVIIIDEAQLDNVLKGIEPEYTYNTIFETSSSRF